MDTTLTTDYGRKTDDELLALAADVDALTQEVRSTLLDELKHRSLDPPSRLEQFRAEQRKHELIDEVDRAHRPTIYGIGCRIFGRANVETLGTNQEYDATIFVVVFYVPLIPLGTYRFVRTQGGSRIEALHKTDLNWSQVAVVWAKSLAVILAILVLFPLLVRA